MAEKKESRREKTQQWDAPNPLWHLPGRCPVPPPSDRPEGSWGIRPARSMRRETENLSLLARECVNEKVLSVKKVNLLSPAE